MKNFPLHLKNILWEYDIDKLDKTTPIVLERVLMMGKIEDAQYIGLPLLYRYFIENQDKFDKKTWNFWSLIFEIKTEKNTSFSPSTYELLNKPVFQRNFR